MQISQRNGWTGRRLCALAIAATVQFLPIAAGAAPGWVKKAISAEWTWFEDYVFLWATYTLACSPGCSCQAGMGLMAFGEPRGEKIRFNGSREVLVIGAGAIHIRVVDGGSGCSAALAPGKFGLVPLVDLSW